MENIRCEIDDVIAFITISNPGKLNALNMEMWNALAMHFTELNKNTNLRCIIIRGADGHFAAGADVQEFATVRNTLADGMRYHNQVIASALKAISECQHPVVAAIEGVCVGGGLEIAISSDIRIASPNARFGIPINKLGFPLAPKELKSLLGLVGKAVALEILLEGRILNAIEAKQKGLVQRLSDDVSLEALETAKRIAMGAPLAARLNKKFIRRLSFMPEPLSDAEQLEAFSFLETDDYQEGVLGFLAKKVPVFTGK
ncbi:enoyl-CoA hydratase/isomerase family protein [Undibacterium fentianense]|uniref:Enoyl-CoA hydratase/isomerase family protein n=1 Tax=Undibacterium fentianense TaxID=2828728 RepID=A0A941IEZ4_9BURK|nr:enoyl-CoA hydratase-related protein [Undibacterium fentianense]MBR7800161.1 enoyl-CoA hydratase/isomerase family protein [Undibacterium fentianense]